MTRTRQYLAAAAVGAAAFVGSAYLCRLPGPGPSPLDGCRKLSPSTSFLLASEYRGTDGIWTAENGDGPIIGYSITEDSPLYNTAHCAERSN